MIGIIIQIYYSILTSKSCIISFNVSKTPYIEVHGSRTLYMVFLKLIIVIIQDSHITIIPFKGMK